MKNMKPSLGNLSKIKSTYKILFKRFKAITLIEISIGLVIVGLMIFGALKGWKWVESTKINNTISQILQIQSAHQSFNQTTHKKMEHWKDIEPFGGPTPDENNQIITSIGAKLSITGDKIILAPLNAIQAYQIKNSLDSNPDLSQGWITVVNTEDQPQKTLDLNIKDKNYKINIFM